VSAQLGPWLPRGRGGAGRRAGEILPETLQIWKKVIQLTKNQLVKRKAQEPPKRKKGARGVSSELSFGLGLKLQRGTRSRGIIGRGAVIALYRQLPKTRTGERWGGGFLVIGIVGLNSRIEGGFRLKFSTDAAGPEESVIGDWGFDTNLGLGGMDWTGKNQEQFFRKQKKNGRHSPPRHLWGCAPLWMA